jgi:hypothetical protein
MVTVTVSGTVNSLLCSVSDAVTVAVTVEQVLRLV